jgi:hypothetical protein
LLGLLIEQIAWMRVSRTSKITAARGVAGAR